MGLNGGSGHASGSTLPPSHPLLAELASLRQQLAQYQKSGHQSAIQLQGARLELSLAKEECSVLRETNTTLRSEVDVLRKHPLPPTQPPTSTALAELTLAHRRLSTKLDLTEQSLASCQLELASCKQEIVRLGREREGDRAIINELRRAEEEKLEELEWERGERRKAEELKKLCDLALDDYRDLVRDLDPKAVPPSSPISKPLIDLPTDLSSSPRLDTDEGDATVSADEEAPRGEEELKSKSLSKEVKEKEGEEEEEQHPPAPTSKAESISNLMVGQRGVNRLFQDFVTTLSGREREIRRLSDRLEELEHTLSTVTDQLASETEQRMAAESAREIIMRDDASAAKVVERYMTFTQKTHATVHLHLDNLRSRSAATQGTLRKEITYLQRQLRSEQERSTRMRTALDESSEGLTREVAGRRREVGLRLRMIAQEEKRERGVERWLDRVRRTREGVEGAVVEADILEGLLDEGIDACTLGAGSAGTAGGAGAGGASAKDKNHQQRSWRGILGGAGVGGGRRKSVSHHDNTAEESSIARVLLAEELVDTLVKDLQVETERRMELERQRVEWLAQEAVDGRDANADADAAGGGGGGGVMFDLEHEHENEHEHDDTETTNNIPQPAAKADAEHPPEANGNDTLLSPPLETPPPLSPTPAIESLRTIFVPLSTRYEPLQASLHSLSHSIADLRSSLPSSSSSSSTIPLPLPRGSGSSKNPMADPVLVSILDNLHETLEDARVDVEIAIADEERVYSGFEALLGVGESRGVLKEAREFVEHKTGGTYGADAAASPATSGGSAGEGAGGSGFIKLRSKVADLESDLSTLKAKMHELQGMDLASLPSEPISPGGSMEEPEPESDAGGFTAFRRQPSIWDSVSADLRTVTLTPDSIPHANGLGAGAGTRVKLGTGMMSVGRSFSASVISAPRKVGGFAGGLYRPKRKPEPAVKEKEREEEKERMLGGDDVE